jgi:isoamylase
LIGLPFCKEGVVAMLRSFLLAIVVVASAAAPRVATAEVETTPVTSVSFGATLQPDGWVAFGLHVPAAQSVALLLYGAPDDKVPAQSVPMTQIGADWAVRIRGPGIGAGMVYMFRVTGQGTATAAAPYGTVLNGAFVLNDPYSYRTQEVGFSTVYTATPFVDTQTSVYAGGGKSIVYDHATDAPAAHLLIAPQDLIVYELHVQDYTARIAGLAPALRGTYAGLSQAGLKTDGGLSAGLDHLVELGVNAVELMPVMQYDKETAGAAGRVNHWGYMTTNFLAPETRYASNPARDVIELKQLVQALHQRGIAVFMDVVYNHTAEGNWLQDGRLAFKCYNLCDDVPEIYRPSNQFFANDSGTGNDVDFSGNDRFTKQLVRDSLSLWWGAYGIDGFRFDLARVLADGSSNAAVWVDSDPRYAGAHLHAEPWDMGGQWWNFMDSPPWNSQNNRWAKWVGRFRDDARLFSKSDLRDAGTFKRLIEGHGAVPGSDAPASSKPWRSVNFVSIHDGYTLRDCMTFNDSDGSQNCWDSGGDENLRRKREKLLLGLLLTSQGVPLLQQGDEFARSKAAAGQDGAKNSYDWESASGDPAINDVNWVDWRLKDASGAAGYGRELSAWTRGLIALRKRWTHLRRADFADYSPAPRAQPGDPSNDGRFSYAWEGPSAGAPSQIGVVWWGHAGEPDLMVIYNEDVRPFSVTNLGNWSHRPWQIMARSWLPRGQDLCEAADWTTCPDTGGALAVEGRSMAVLATQRE